MPANGEEKKRKSYAGRRVFASKWCASLYTKSLTLLALGFQCITMQMGLHRTHNIALMPLPVTAHHISYIYTLAGSTTFPVHMCPSYTNFQNLLNAVQIPHAEVAEIKVSLQQQSVDYTLILS